MINTATLISKLSINSRFALEKAANLCISLQNYEIEIEHLLLELITQPQNTDFKVILNKYKISTSQLQLDLMNSVNELPKGNVRTPIFSSSIIHLLKQAWLLASAESDSVIRSSHLLVALLTATDLYQMAIRASHIFDLFPIDSLKHKFNDICKSSDEFQSINQSASSDLTPENEPPQELKTPALNQYTVNLTEKAKNGQIDPVIGRENEIRIMLDILMRRRQNNPILTGEPGVGKTAVVEGLALKIASKKVPDELLHVQLHVLDIGLLQAGASVKGEFESRLKQLIKEIQSLTHPVILFIDEAHTMIGAGGQAGQNDAANLLKPALARGELRTIAATTWAEYKLYFEKDAALSRRFQVIPVAEPSKTVAIDMLRAMIPVMSQHFKISIDDAAITAAVHASHRYITGRQLPDKAISVLDTAAARVSLSQHATPVQLEQLQAQIHNNELELHLLKNEQPHSSFHQERINTLVQQIQSLSEEITETEQKWQAELQLIQKIQRLQQNTVPDESSLVTENKMAVLRQELATLQGEQPFVYEKVDVRVVHEIISDWTGIPAGSMLQDEIQQILHLEETLNTRIFGQDFALHQLVKGIKTSRARLEDPTKPLGVFLLTGPSGVGKTETALALADELYGGESHLITINMSEYQEAHSVASLKGAPPGYIGYGQGGILTEAVRRNPYSVILLDEIEKAHSDIHELFYQVFDKGCLEDGEGRLIDFKNTLILLTSNTGSSVISQTCLNLPVNEQPDAESLIELIKPALYKQFKPAFLGRMRVVPYYPLHDDLLIQIIHQKLNKIITRVSEQYGTTVEYNDDLTELLLYRCTEVDSGARNIEHILNASVLPDLATHLLVALSQQKLPSLIHIEVKNDQIHYSIDPETPNRKKTLRKNQSKAA
ncbi:type VI secretion system ATPase TssH [Acinetobacter chinensis]|uniref:Type VI secretion system ATPase TssH n=1 Tax=Acinetobacter chinensis TaxID=2004650 RepID=A0ABU3WBI0_9GAMM|nr:type VI secretion system ATPase TssH [Acinetobacter chinensis]MDV2467766.1 type VI secretion system ATPase TssH [Acinetobacter chinensis]